MAFDHQIKAGLLAGSLVLPPKAKALAIILPGSGPTDRDGNGPNKHGLHTDAYLKLAHGLADAGIASIRADKRGIGASGGDGNAVSLDDYVADSALWLQWPSLVESRETHPELPSNVPLWLIGHSEGGLIAMATAQKHRVQGIVLLCCPGRPVGEVLLDQLSRDPANLSFLGQVGLILHALQEGMPADTASLPPQLAGLFHPLVQGYWTSLLRSNPAALIAALACPVLIIGGGKDLQVPATDAAELASHAVQAQTQIFPDMNHVLTDVLSGIGSENIASYTNPTLPLSPSLLPMITQFILDRP